MASAEVLGSQRAMSPADLRAAGEVLYGERWQSSLARDLDVTDRTMRRWAHDGPPDTVVAEIDALLAARQVAIARLRRAGG